MIIREFYRGKKHTTLEVASGKLIFNVSMDDKKISVFVYSNETTPQRLNYFTLNNALVLQFEGDGITVSFSDKDDFISCMQTAFDDCPSDDIRSIFETMFYTE